MGWRFHATSQSIKLYFGGGLYLLHLLHHFTFVGVLQLCSFQQNIFVIHYPLQLFEVISQCVLVRFQNEDTEYEEDEKSGRLSAILPVHTPHQANFFHTLYYGITCKYINSNPPLSSMQLDLSLINPYSAFPSSLISLPRSQAFPLYKDTTLFYLTCYLVSR